MNPLTWAVTVALVVLAGTLAAIEAGFRWGRRDMRAGTATHEGVGAVEASAFALLGLLLGFSFAGATARLESKRALIVDEANAIGTAYLRIDLLPTDAQAELRARFRRMMDARLRVYADRASPEDARRDQQLVDDTQRDIWRLAVAATAAHGSDERTPLVLAALNEMMDVTQTRVTAFETHIPTVIIWVLLGSVSLSGLLVGYAMARRERRSLMHVAAYAVMLGLTIYVVLDLDSPRFGLIRIEPAYQALVALRATMQ